MNLHLISGKILIGYSLGGKTKEIMDPSFPSQLQLTHCCSCEKPLSSGTGVRAGGAELAGGCPGSGLQTARARQHGLHWSGAKEAVGTDFGHSKFRSSERTRADCCCWTCWRPTSPGAGHTPEPHSSSSWWTDGPCLCYCTKKEDDGEAKRAVRRLTSPSVFYLEYLKLKYYVQSALKLS